MDMVANSISNNNNYYCT